LQKLYLSLKARLPWLLLSHPSEEHKDLIDNSIMTVQEKMTQLDGWFAQLESVLLLFLFFVFFLFVREGNG
jgi:hypothetical protein